MPQQQTEIQIIKDVFDKTRDPLRKLNTIIKVVDSSKESLWTEFEEFVLTPELLEYLHFFVKHFEESGGLFGNPIWAFWLQGFYGSGKSHFSKVIGYLLKNDRLEDPLSGTVHPTVDFFVENTLKPFDCEVKTHAKWRDALVDSLQILPKKYATHSLFYALNKYAKSDGSDARLESFTYALLREFNVYLGLCEEVYTAELERALIKDAKYDQFKQEVEDHTGKSWEDNRKSIPRARKTFFQVYPKMEGCSELIAKEYYEGAKDQVNQRKVDDVLNEINAWVQAQDRPKEGLEARMLLILDEAGIFFSANESRISELQTAAEWVNTKQNESRVYMLFTSQQDLKKHFQTINKEAEYRKTDQRFKKWKLGKKNIQTVVVRRWLKKDGGKGEAHLAGLVDQKYHHIKDCIAFDLIKDPKNEFIIPAREQIIETYPFLPYQFPLMINITQKLIEREVVKEEVGGKTRSILSMTRDVLHNKSNVTQWLERQSKLAPGDRKHFIEDQVGSFANMAQIFDTISRTLERDAEDALAMVEGSRLLEENPQEFSKDELEFPLSFQDVAKAIFLFQYIDEIYPNEQNIARALFFSVDRSKQVLFEKVRKLVAGLLDHSIITYEKKTVDHQGKKEDVYWYKIATKEEQDFFKGSRKQPVDEENRRARLQAFFQSGMGKDFLPFKDKVYLSHLFGQGNADISLKKAINLKANWFVDPDLDTVLGKIDERANVSVFVCVLTSRSFFEEIGEDHLKPKNPKDLERKMTLVSVKAFKRGKILIFLHPNLDESMEKYASQTRAINKALAEIHRLETETVEAGSTLSPAIRNSVMKRIQDHNEDLKQILKPQLEAGGYLCNRSTYSLRADELVKRLNDIIVEQYSKINPYAYLGQLGVTGTDVRTVLTWDPKKNMSISANLKTPTDQNPEAIQVFNTKNQLTPNKAPQYSEVARQFTLLTQETPEVAGSKLLELFTSSPYAWNEWTLLTVVAASAKMNDVEIRSEGGLKNPASKEVLEAFTSKTKNFEKFQQLGFKKAEVLDITKLNQAKQILASDFDHVVDSPAHEQVSTGIQTALRTFATLVKDTGPSVRLLNLDPTFSGVVARIDKKAQAILDITHPTERIKSFLASFGEKDKEAEDLQVPELRKILYQVKNLDQEKQLDRYIRVREFLETTVPEWIQADKSASVENWANKVTGLKEALVRPQIVFKEGWSKFWAQFSPLWEAYWKSYTTLHANLQATIKEALAAIHEDPNAKDLRIKPRDKLTAIFSCDHDLSAEDAQTFGSFVCEECGRTFTLLKLNQGQVETQAKAIWDAINEIATGPTPVEEDSWAAYANLHHEIEEKRAEIASQKSAFKEFPEALALIDGVVKEIEEDPNLLSNHQCSARPREWRPVSARVCTQCQRTHEELLDVYSAIDKRYRTLLEQLSAISRVTLPYQREIAVDMASPKARAESKAFFAEIQKILARLEEQEKDGSRRFKLSVQIEKEGQ